MTSPAGPELLPDGFVHGGRERTPRPTAGGALRSTAAVLLAVLALLLTAGGLVATWARGELLDTDRYVAVVGPLGSDPQVQADVAAMVTTAVTGNLGNRVPAAARTRVRSEVSAAAAGFTASAAFTTLWTDLNRAGHEHLVRLLRGDARPVPGATVRGGRLRLDLTPAVDAVRRDVAGRLRPLGVPASALPRVSLSIDVAGTDSLARLRPWVHRLDLVARWAPWAALACVALAVAVARDRLLALAGSAVAVGLGAGLVLLVAFAGAGVAVARLEAAGATTGVGPAVVDRLAAPLETSALRVAGGAVAVAVLAAGARGVVRARRRPRST